MLATPLRISCIALMVLLAAAPARSTSMALAASLPGAEDALKGRNYADVRRSLRPWMNPELNADTSTEALRARYLYAVAMCKDNTEDVASRAHGLGRLKALRADLDKAMGRNEGLTIKSSDAADMTIANEKAIKECEAPSAAAAFSSDEAAAKTLRQPPPRRQPGSGPGVTGTIRPQLNDDDFQLHLNDLKKQQNDLQLQLQRRVDMKAGSAMQR